MWWGEIFLSSSYPMVVDTVNSIPRYRLTFNVLPFFEMTWGGFQLSDIRCRSVPIMNIWYATGVTLQNSRRSCAKISGHVQLCFNCILNRYLMDCFRSLVWFRPAGSSVGGCAAMSSFLIGSSSSSTDRSRMSYYHFGSGFPSLPKGITAWKYSI